MAGLGKQAKILLDKQVALALAAVATRRSRSGIASSFC